MLNVFVRRSLDLLQTVAGVLFIALFVLNILRIAARFFFGIAWIWLPDLTRFLFIWVVFIGASVLVGRNEHLLMDVLLEHLKPAGRRRLSLFIQAAQAAFCLLLIVVGSQIAVVRMGIPFDTWDFPTGWAYLAVPVCAAFMLVYSFNLMMQNLKSKENET
jgi:TRAP-type C4-dicarboxylate transport system permease small subunit